MHHSLEFSALLLPSNTDKRGRLIVCEVSSGAHFRSSKKSLGRAFQRQKQTETPQKLSHDRVYVSRFWMEKGYRQVVYLAEQTTVPFPFPPD